jgi:hypothetical protein
MSVDVTVERRIARSRPEVAAFAMDPRNDMSWIGALTSVRQLTEGPVAVGTQVERVAAFLGRRIEYVNDIMELEQGRRLAMRSIRAPFPMVVTYDFVDSQGGTVARIRAQGDASGFYRLALPLLSFMVRRGIARDLRSLQRVLEQESHARHE